MKGKRGTIHLSLRVIIVLILILLLYSAVYYIVINIVRTGVNPGVQLDRDTENSFDRVYSEILDMEPRDSIKVPLIVKGAEVVFYALEPDDGTRERPEECKQKACMCVYSITGYGYRCKLLDFEIKFTQSLPGIDEGVELEQTLVRFHNTKTIILNRDLETIEIGAE